MLDSGVVKPVQQRPQSSYGSLVLVADDGETARTVTRSILEKAGFSVIVAADGLQAVERYREQSAVVDAVLLDTSMPGLNGEEAAHEIKRIRPEVKAVL